MANISISLAGIDQAIEGLKYRAGSVKSLALNAVRSHYTSEESIKDLEAIDTDTLIRNIWDVGDNPAKIKAKRRNFYSIKSSINVDLKKLSKKGQNAENIILSDTNIFDMSEEAKNNLLNSFSDAVRTGDINLDQATVLLKTVTEFLENFQMDEAGIDAQNIVEQIKKILNKITEDVLKDEALEEDPGVRKLKVGDDLFGDDTEDIEEIELDEDEEIEDVEEDELLDDEVEEIVLDEDEDLEEVEIDDEAAEDEDIEEIELDEDEELEEVEEDDLLDDEVEEIALHEDEDLEEVEIDDEALEDEDIEEIELDEDEELKEVEEDDLLNDEVEEIELDEDEDLEEVEIDEEAPEDEDIEEIELGEDEELEEVEADELLDDEVEEIALDEDEDIEEIEIDEDEEIEEVEEDELLDDEIEEIDLEADEEIVEVDDDAPFDDDAEVIDLDEDEELEDEALEALEEVEEIDPDDVEEVDELDEEELKALEEFRKNRELAEQFDNVLGDREKKYNRYVTVPAGLYTVGTQKKLKSNLELQQFEMPKVYIGIYPVTNALFEIFIEETGYVTTAEKKGFGRVYTSRYSRNKKKSSWSKNSGSQDVEGAFWYQPSGPGSTLHEKRNHPVVQVSVDDAWAFASWIGRRLPTEAEWESAARTDLGYKYPWGNQFDIKALNIEGSGIGGTIAVDRFEAFANDFKIVDLLGNVMEWTCDTQEPPIPTKNSTQYSIAKGAAWNAKEDVSISSRGLFKPGFTSNTIGFRCISELFQ